MSILWVMLPVLLAYLALTANVEAANLVAGLGIGAGAALLLRPGRAPLAPRRILDALLASIQYVLVVVIDVLKSGFRVARILLAPSLLIRPGVVAIPSRCESQAAVALSAHALTMAPGEVVIEVDDDGVLYTHCLDVTHSQEYIFEAQRLRRELLRRIFV